MPTYRVHVNRPQKKIYVLPLADAAPANTVVAGQFVHDIDIEAEEPLESSVNHVIFHHIQEILGKAKDSAPNTFSTFPDNITDLGNYQIFTTPPPIPVDSVELGADFSIAVAATHQLVPVFTPTDATNKAVTYSSATPAVATVNSSGLVTGVSAGTSVITVTTVDGAKTDMVTATITA